MSAFLNRLSVRDRIRAIVAIFIGSVVLGSVIDVFMLRQALRGEKELKTRQVVESAHGVLAHYYDRQRRGELSAAAARTAAVATLKAMRYDGKEYFWINDLGAPFPAMVMHPTVPALDGQVLAADKFNRATGMRIGNDGPFVATGGGKNLFVAFVEVVRAGGQGYVAYDWPKPLAGGGATAELYPKLSYVKGFEPWGWLVGSGVYIDDIDRAVRAEATRHVLLVAGIGTLLLFFASVIAGSITRPLKATVAAMREIGGGTAGMGRRLPLAGGGEIAELAGGFNEMLEGLQARDAELARHRAYLEEEVARRTAQLHDTNRQLETELAEHKRAEQALRESRTRMRALIDATSESVLLLDPEGRILAINAFGAQRFGRQPQEMAGSNFLSFLPPALAGARRSALQHVAATGEPMHTQDRRGGTFFDNSLYPVQGESGKVESIAVYAKDVSEQQRTRQVDGIFRHLDAMLLKWGMNLESVAQIFCDGVLPVFDLAAAWIGRAEKDGRLTLLAGAEADGGAFLDRLRGEGLRWDGEPACCLPAGAVVRSGQRQLLAPADPPSQSCGLAAGPAGTAAVLLLPLTLRGESWGILALYGRDSEQFAGPQLPARLSAIAGRLGVSLESALQQEWLTLLESALSEVSNAVLITDAEGGILWANRACVRLSGYPVEEMLGKTPRLFSSGIQDAEFYRRFWATLRAGRTWHGDIVNTRRDGRRYTTSQTVTPLRNANGQVSHYAAIVEDITERRAQEDRMRHTANFDILTDLPNRGLFFDRLGQILALARRDGLGGAVLFLDLDRFKEVNDQLGHAAGDQLLVTVARRLREQVRESDTVARLGGDEFTVILPHLHSAADAAWVAEKILAAVAQPLTLAGREVKIGVSIGIALFPEHGNGSEQILNAADHAMYLAKQAGRNRYAFAAGEAVPGEQSSLQGEEK